VQFSGRNHSLVGDRRYGGLPCDRLALWAAELTFFLNGQKETFTAFPPEQDVWSPFKNRNL
jgi:23S rRNA-/tRNA-specific pseudouridylate synthase